jgi:hypothetical protein
MNALLSHALPLSLPRRTLLAVLLCLLSSGLLAQAPNLNYTVDMPSVDRIKAEIKGSDPTDTLARQTAVFTYIQQWIQRIKTNRTVRGPYTPDEQKLLAAYALAAYQIPQDFAKTHTPDEVKAFNTLEGKYEFDTAFYQDWTKRLIGPQATAAYHQMEGEMAQRQQQHIAQINQQNQEAAAAAAAPAGGSGGRIDVSKDPTSIATRRCLELGGSNIACLGKGLGAGGLALLGLGDGEMEKLTGPGQSGVVLTGFYKASAGGAGVTFTEGSASSVDCGNAIPVGYSVTLEKQPGALRIHVASAPTPYTLSMRPDGGLNGPGPIDITGKIIVGYHTVTHQVYQNGVPISGCAGGMCTTSEQVPDYAPKTEHCSIGSLTAPPKPAPSAQQQQQPASQDAGLFGMLTEVFNTGEMNINTEPGFRIVGKYGSGNLLAYFTSTSVVIDCGQAHVRDTYTVENGPNNFIIHIANSGDPLTLTVEPGNALQGSGNATINGRLVNGMNGDNITYAPHSETCPIGTLHPSTASPATSSTAIASNSPAPVAPATEISPAPRAAVPAPTANPTSTTTPASSGPKAPMRVIITSQFPTSPNPLVGQTVFVMRERMDDVLRKLNIPVPPNTSPGKAMQMLVTACQSTDCKPLFDGMAQYYVTGAKLDSTGKATLTATAATGNYFFYAVVRTAQGSYVWDLPATLNAGDNNITLTPSNAELLH